LVFNPHHVPFLDNLSNENLWRYSPELYEAMCSVLASDEHPLGQALHEVAPSSRIFHKTKALAQALCRPEVLAIAATEQLFVETSRTFWAGGLDLKPDEFSRLVNQYGSLVAYALAEAGNSQNLDMLKVIAGLPRLIVGPMINELSNPTFRTVRKDTESTAELIGVLCMATAGAPDQFLRSIAICPMPEKVSRLLGVDHHGVCSFERANAVSDLEMSTTFDEVLYQPLARRHRLRAKMAPDMWLCYAGPAIVGLSMTQSHVFLERGVDPKAVHALAQRRLRAFYSLMRAMPLEIDKLVSVGASAPFFCFSKHRVPDFVDPVDYAGVDFLTARALDDKGALNVVRQAQGLIAGPLSFFRKRADPEVHREVLDHFQTLSIKDRFVGEHVHAFDADRLERCACYNIGVGQLSFNPFVLPGAIEGFRTWHLKNKDVRRPFHPMLRNGIYWVDWADESVMLAMFPALAAARWIDDDVARCGLAFFAWRFPVAYDRAYAELMTTHPKRTTLDRAAEFISPDMLSFENLRPKHWANRLESDLGI
jgi:hypothetical protein